MKYVKYGIITLFCLILLLISGRITRSLAYGLTHQDEFEDCTYPQRSSTQIDPIHAGETGLLKKHICTK